MCAPSRSFEYCGIDAKFEIKPLINSVLHSLESINMWLTAWFESGSCSRMTPLLDCVDRRYLCLWWEHWVKWLARFTIASNWNWPLNKRANNSKITIMEGKYRFPLITAPSVANIQSWDYNKSYFISVRPRYVPTFEIFIQYTFIKRLESYSSKAFYRPI